MFFSNGSMQKYWKWNYEKILKMYLGKILEMDLCKKYWKGIINRKYIGNELITNALEMD